MGNCSMPLIYGNLLIIASQAPEAGVVAYNKLTGDVIWKTAALGAVGFVSPSIAKINGEDQIVMITASSGRGATAVPSNVVGINRRTELCFGPIQTGVAGFLHRVHLMPGRTRS